MKKHTQQIFSALSIGFCYFIFTSTKWLINTYGEHLNFDNFLFHIFIGTQGVEGADASLFHSFIQKALLKSIKATLYIYLIFIIANCLTHPTELQKKLQNWIKPVFIFLSNILMRKLLFVLLLLSSIGFFVYKLKVVEFIENIYGDDIFTQYYITPTIEETKQNPKNLILIYIESLENTFAREDVHGKNLIKFINNLPGHHVDYFFNAPGTTWTTAGIVGSQCGIPLKPVLINALGKKRFLPGITCLGDILAKNNYSQYLLTAADKEFGGKNILFSDHGYQNIIGLEEWEERGLPRDLFTGWGDSIHDDTLYDQALEIITQADQEKKPYNFSLITTDTHAVDGYPSTTCAHLDRHIGLPGAVKCASKLASNFVTRLEKKGLLKNTIIVIMGDHLFMNNKHQKHLFPDPRYVYFKYISPDQNMIPKRNKMNHFDIAPSILHLMGINSKENERFGLGISLFSNISEEDYEKHFKAVTDKKILNHSDLYNSFYKSK